MTLPTLFFGYLSVRGVPIVAIWTAVRSADFTWFVPSLLLFATSIFLRAVRWRLLFTPGRRPPLRSVTSALLISYLFNQLLPARAGEAARIVALHRDAGTPRAECLATVLTERIFDVLSLLVILFIALPVLPRISWIKTAGIVGAVIALVVLVFAGLLTRYDDRLIAVVLRPLGRLRWVSSQRLEFASRQITDGLAAVRRPRVALEVLGVTVASWLVMALSYWLLSKCFAFHVGIMAGMLVVITVNLSMVIPSSPAALGVFEAAALLALKAFGIDHAHALAFALVLHGLNWFPFLVAGAVVMGLRRRTTHPESRPIMQGAGPAFESP